MSAARYRKKPVVVEAIRWDGSEESIAAVCGWANRGKGEPVVSYLTAANVTGPLDVFIETLNGPVSLLRGEWVVKGIAGEFYPCKDSIFGRHMRRAGMRSATAGFAQRAYAAERRNEMLEATKRLLVFTQFVAWLDKPQCSEIRRKITLARLIEKANEALGGVHGE